MIGETIILIQDGGSRHLQSWSLLHFCIIVVS